VQTIAKLILDIFKPHFEFTQNLKQLSNHIEGKVLLKESESSFELSSDDSPPITEAPAKVNEDKPGDNPADKSVEKSDPSKIRITDVIPVSCYPVKRKPGQSIQANKKSETHVAQKEINLETGFFQGLLNR
jgi:hypothetical protein